MTWDSHDGRNMWDSRHGKRGITRVAPEGQLPQVLCWKEDCDCPSGSTLVFEEMLVALHSAPHFSPSRRASTGEGMGSMKLPQWSLSSSGSDITTSCEHNCLGHWGSLLCLCIGMTRRRQCTPYPHLTSDDSMFSMPEKKRADIGRTYWGNSRNRTSFHPIPPIFLLWWPLVSTFSYCDVPPSYDHLWQQKTINTQLILAMREWERLVWKSHTELKYLE